MMNREEVTKLIEELHAASESYYQKMETSPLTDEEFDEKLSFLQEICDSGAYPDLFETDQKGGKLLEAEPALGTKTNSSETVTHSNPMLSLSKANTELELQNWVKKVKSAGAKDFRLQAKMDGFALSAHYKNGKLTTLATRGDGVTGENISFLLNNPEIEIVGLPNELPTSHSVKDMEVRGELIFTNEQFKKANTSRHETFTKNKSEKSNAVLEDFKNPRNALVGTMRKAKLGLGFKAEMTFAAYAYYKENTLTDLKELSKEFKTVDSITSEQTKTKLTGFKTTEEMFKSVEAFGKAREKGFSIPTDGVVIKPTNEAELQKAMGNSTHHPYSQIAFKYPGEKATTVLRSIDFTVGKTGKINPIGRVDTVHIDGSDVSNVSLHNLNYIYENNIKVGATVVVVKANDIIPQIKIVISTPEDSVLISVPEHCPVCSTKTTRLTNTTEFPPKTLICPNDTCPGREKEAILTAVKRDYLDIDGMSTGALQHLIDTGRIKTIADLYTLTVNELAPLPIGKNKKTGKPIRIGVDRATNIVDHIETSKNHPLYRLLASLNVSGLGRTVSKFLVKTYGTIENIQNATVEDLETLEGLGTKTAMSIVSGLKARSDIIQKMKDSGVLFGEPSDDNLANTNHGETSNNQTSTSSASVSNNVDFSGKSFSISGTVPAPFSNRNALVDFIEEKGGVFHSSPKASTSYMIGDVNDTSSKIKKASTLGIRFLTPEEFTEKFVN